MSNAALPETFLKYLFGHYLTGANGWFDRDFKKRETQVATDQGYSYTEITEVIHDDKTKEE